MAVTELPVDDIVALVLGSQLGRLALTHQRQRIPQRESISRRSVMPKRLPEDVDLDFLLPANPFQEVFEAPVGNRPTVTVVRQI